MIFFFFYLSRGFLELRIFYLLLDWKEEDFWTLIALISQIFGDIVNCRLYSVYCRMGRKGFFSFSICSGDFWIYDFLFTIFYWVGKRGKRLKEYVGFEFLFLRWGIVLTNWRLGSLSDYWLLTIVPVKDVYP